MIKITHKVVTFAETETLSFANGMDGNNVIKTGRTTGTTHGRLKLDSLSIRMDKSFAAKGYMIFNNCFEVIDKKGFEAFFEPGDSGAGVFVEKENGTLKPLGIAFASMNSQTAVCKIDAFVKELKLAIVNKQSREEEKMDYSIRNSTWRKRKLEERMNPCPASPARKKRKK